jgi:hypothetical protein
VVNAFEREEKECGFDVLMDVRNPSKKLPLSIRINIGSRPAISDVRNV